MIYTSADDWRAAPHKRIALFGMSGLGKTHTADMLRDSGDWFHYSVDYRIGTRYLGELIEDNFKREAMKVPFLRELLMSDSISISSKIGFDDLKPLSTYLGKPGDPAKGGIEIAQYRARQRQHHHAEVAALLDTPDFIGRAEDIYGYPHFVCDTGGSICEVVNPDDPSDPVLTALSKHLLLVWIEGTDDQAAELIARFNKAPKPMCYRDDFLSDAWDDYLRDEGVAAQDVDPDAFQRATFARAVAHRRPIYAAMARNWGVKISASDLAGAGTPDALTELIAQALETAG